MSFVADQIGDAFARPRLVSLVLHSVMRRAWRSPWPMSRSDCAQRKSDAAARLVALHLLGTIDNPASGNQDRNDQQSTAEVTSGFSMIAMHAEMISVSYGREIGRACPPIPEDPLITGSGCARSTAARSRTPRHIRLKSTVSLGDGRRSSSPAIWTCSLRCIAIAAGGIARPGTEVSPLPVDHKYASRTLASCADGNASYTDRRPCV